MPLQDAKHWRERAAHMRLLAQEVKEAEVASAMHTLADDYDKLADRAVLRAAVSQTRAITRPGKTQGAGR